MDGQALRHKLRKAAASAASGLVAVKAEVNGLEDVYKRQQFELGLPLQFAVQRALADV